MASIAIFLYPDRIGMSRMKSAGAKPGYAPMQWLTVADMSELLREPAMLASQIRTLVGDGKCDIYLNLWSGAYQTIMFSHGKSRKADVNRLRQSELETVFHGEHQKMYTFDYPLDKGKASFNGKSRHIIYVAPKERINVMVQAFKAMKMTLKKVTPFEATLADSALALFAPEKDKINACLMLDDAGTTLAFFKNQALQSIRTIPNMMNDVLRDYLEVTGMSADRCRQMILEQGMAVDAENFAFPTLQDSVVSVANKLKIEIAKTLHSVFGDDAILDKMLICGAFARTIGFAEYMEKVTEVPCVVAGADTLKNTQGVVLEPDTLEQFFPFALATAPKCVDLMSEWKKNRSDRRSGILLSVLVTLAAAGVMAITPYQAAQLQKEYDEAAALLQQEDYLAVKALFDENAQKGKDYQALEEAIANLPHGESHSADIVRTIHQITSDYGTVLEISVDYNAPMISLNFSTLNYDSFVLWQNKLTESGRFSFIKPPTYEGSGLLYMVEASITATDFVEEEVTEEVAE